AGPPRDKAVRAADGVAEPDRSRPLTGAPRAAGGPRARPEFLRAGGRRLLRRALRRRAAAAAARAGAGARDLLRLAVEDRRRRPADGLDRGARPGVRPPRDAEARERLPHEQAGPAHHGALFEGRAVREAPRGLEPV